MTQSANYEGIDHIGLAVHDIDAATKTYHDMLGFAVGGEEVMHERGLHVRFMETGNSRIELLAPLNDRSQISGFLAKRGEGVHHICVRVSNIHEKLAQLKANGATLLNETPEKGAHNTLVAFLHPKGCHGLLLELVQYPLAKITQGEQP